MIRRRGILVVKSPASQEARKRKKITPGLIGMNIIAQLHEPCRNRKMKIDLEWIKVLNIASCTKPVSVHGFAKVAGKSQVRIPAGSVSVVRVNGWQGGRDLKTVTHAYSCPCGTNKRTNSGKHHCHQYCHPSSRWATSC